MGLRFILAAPLLVFYWICVAQIQSVYSEKGYTICDLQGCNCSKKAAMWKYVNCTFGNTQDVELKADYVHNLIVEVFITGGNSIRFSQKAFHSLPGLSLVRIDGTNLVHIATKSFYNLTSSSLLLQIENCDQLTIKTGAFEDMQSFLDTEIYKTQEVSIGKFAFSKLSSSRFKDIQKLELSESTFEFKNQGNIGRHGPVTNIFFENVIIPEIPQGTFFSSLASITILSSKINEIHNGAFRANEISAISIKNTSVDVFYNGAFTNRSLIKNFKISKCNISRLESHAILAAFFNFTVHHSIITEIEKEAVCSTVANVEIIGNEIGDFHSDGFRFENWNKIFIEDNIIKNLEPNFINAVPNVDIKNFTFKGNEMYNVEQNALNFMSELESKIIFIDDNFFNQSCACSIEEWLKGITNNSKRVETVAETSFCTVNDYLSSCFALPVGLINIKNFTELACMNKTIICEPYKGEVRTVNTSSKILFQDDSNKKTWVILILTITGLLIICAMVTFVIILIRGGRWLKRKGYFRNVHYNHNETSHDDENTMVTMDYNETLETPEELTLDFLQLLSQKLDDPATHQQASEMIERLYEMFVVDDNYDNNARQEEAHLYEELGNIPPPPYEEEKPQNTNGARSILKLMEEKLNFQNEDDDDSGKPSLKGEYSEPSDAAVHLYSELKQNKLDQKSSSVKSNLDGMGSRPLPSKPNENNFMEAGPSSKSND